MLASPPRPADEAVSPRLYIERVLFTPTADAEAAFELTLELNADEPPAWLRYRFSTVAGELILFGPMRRPARPPASAVYPVRVIEGCILSRTGIYRMRVELELLRWSGRASALGLRPRTHRRHPFGFGPYLRIGGDVMTGLRKEIEAWAKAGAGARSA